jgi:O-antigen/teichoic acid export membrane protein
MLLNTLSTQIPVFLLTYFFDNVIVGFFAFGLRLLNKPVNLIATSMAQVFYQQASRARNESKEKLTGLVWKLFSKMTLLGLLPVIILFTIAPQMFKLIFGAEWQTAGEYVRWLLPWYYLIFLTKPIMNVINIEMKQKVNLYFNIGFLVSRIMALMTGGLLKDPLLTVILYGMAGFIAKMIHLVWILKISGIRPDMIRNRIS